ncbi:MAG: hypothetical protein V4686_02450 [Patescibacteria group bacterium]
MNIPYIGITDFMNYEQVERMLAVFEANKKPGQNRRLHVGVMMSYKTLNKTETKWSKAFPANDDIRHIFQSSETMNCLHYADYEGVDVWRNLAKAIEFGGYLIDALQLDMVWPDPVAISTAVHTSRKFPEVILQIGKNAMEEAGNDPAQVVERLQDYNGIIHHVLLDKSMGRGLGMDAVGLLPYARAIRDAYPDLGLAVAGGLGPNTMGLVKPLLEEFPHISIDAQGQLRPSGNALDPIDWDMAEKYIVNALALLE